MITILEGFDGVGKDRFINTKLSDLDNYRPTYQVFDKYQLRDSAWLIGYSIFDFVNQTSQIKDFVLNRWIASSYVYYRLNHTGVDDQSKANELFSGIVMDYANTIDPSVFSNTVIYHLRHLSKSSAKEIYPYITNRPDNEPLDSFEDFEQYYERYLIAESYYQEFYNDILLPRSPISINYIYNGGIDLGYLQSI